ncbi:DUF7352 domain-containing protein [Actinoplanes siamensis]|uniref:DUF7352 domain-containing protein n=1 Tax=Actinoplanes siamensis TaxID=1223317 RepID=A0A919NCP3_9ACTN|nr:hypothetical protein [Actinoplanes siamensis]GIF08696.1 hypothetical protein Asi03nite_62340 [Actinoplanes siamensis]
MGETRTIYRSAIPVDDGQHVLDLTGPIVHVATRSEDYVEVWHIHNPGEPADARTFRVYGTGHPDVEGVHVGTAVTPSGRLVWHLMELGGERRG